MSNWCPREPEQELLEGIVKVMQICTCRTTPQMQSGLKSYCTKKAPIRNGSGLSNIVKGRYPK